jgi:hypothetical protein
MQLQIECNNVPSQQQSCSICSQAFEMAEARIIVCNDQGKDCGEVCSICLSRGFDWLSDRFDQLNQAKKPVLMRRTQRLEIPIGA